MPPMYFNLDVAFTFGTRHISVQLHNVAYFIGPYEPLRGEYLLS